VAGGSSSALDAAFIPAYQSQYWYDRRTSGPTPSATMSGVQPLANLICYLPVYCYQALTIDSLALLTYVAFSAGSAARLGVYTMTAAGAPGTLLLDAGSITLPTTAGVALTSTAAATTLPKGWSLLAASFNSSTASGYAYGLNAQATPPQWAGQPASGFNPGAAGQTGSILEYRQSGTGVLPATAAATAYYGAGSSYPPLNVFYKAA
jgi:hypothetical protein